MSVSHNNSGIGPCSPQPQTWTNVGLWELYGGLA